MDANHWFIPQELLPADTIIPLFFSRAIPKSIATQLAKQYSEGNAVPVTSVIPSNLIQFAIRRAFWNLGATPLKASSMMNTPLKPAVTDNDLVDGIPITYR